jgi:integrase
MARRDLQSNRHYETNMKPDTGPNNVCSVIYDLRRARHANARSSRCDRHDAFRHLTDSPHTHPAQPFLVGGTAAPASVNCLSNSSLAAGAHVVAVARLLGHASPNVTLSVYSHLFENDLDDVAARLDAAAERSRQH